GVSLSAFRIAGGILLFLMGIDMARHDFAARFEDVVEGGEPQTAGVYARKRFERLLVPFAMPLLIGPGAISTVVIYASEARGLGAAGYVAGLGVIAAVSLSIAPIFWTTGLIS